MHFHVLLSFPRIRGMIMRHPGPFDLRDPCVAALGRNDTRQLARAGLQVPSARSLSSYSCKMVEVHTSPPPSGLYVISPTAIAVERKRNSLRLGSQKLPTAQPLSS